ncbi:MAG: hypothetical protein H7Z41_16570, partial [Cytophagales bacterium]|nr:hypothetical protein [Armatimonadota bacterium]
MVLLLPLWIALCLPVPSAASPRTYAQDLSLAIAAMEQGKHPSGLTPLRAALTTDRGEPLGLVALGTLYLHAGSPVAASAEFRRALVL